jgi:glycosidase
MVKKRYTTLLTLLFIGICLPIVIAQNTLRVEPPFWWLGMEDSELQIVLYGEEIGLLKPHIDYDGLVLDRVVSVESDNYLFLYLNITEQAKAGSFTIQLKSGDKTVERIPYELKQRKEGSKYVKGFDASDVMYLITPDRFANGNKANDYVAGMKEKPNRSFDGGRHGGDIAGLRKNLDYISDMGFTAIWLNPVLENDMPDYSYHGYAATDFYKVDARYGSNQEYVDFIAEAKSKGIKVIMDMILNHSGSEHWMVLDPPTKDWINFDGKFSGTSHRKHTIQDIHASEFDRKQFVDGWFVETMPDLNQRNPLFSDYLITNTLWWIEYSGISGIRMDTYPYPDKDFMTDWTQRIMQEYPNFNIVGEEWIGNPAIVSYWQAGKKNHDGYVSYLPSLMDFPVQEALRDALTTEERNYGSGLILLYEMVAMDFLYPSPEDLVIFPDNHDMDRFFTTVKGDVALMKMALAYFSTMRGTPQIYYGTEILMNNDEAPNNHGVIRSDFPGGWEGDKVNGFTGKGLNADQKDVQSYLKKILNWRKGAKPIHNGKLMQFVPFDGVYAHFRYTEEGDTVLFMMNRMEKDRKVDLQRFEEIIEGFTTATDVVTGKTYNLKDGSLSISGKTALILTLE